MREFRLAIAAALLTASSWGATYYVSSSNGNDLNSGTSPAAPWRTLAKVNSSTFNPGDSILLLRGDTWRESLVPPSSGTSSNTISFDAYGSGPAPIITGLLDLPSSAWTLVSGNLWRAPVSATLINNVLFGTIWGQKQTSQGAVTHDRDFYFSGTYLYVFASSTPATYYGNVGAVLTGGGQLLFVNGKSWLRFQHILLNWFDGSGVNVSGASDHLIFANMESDGMVPAGTRPHGFYVNASPAPTDINFFNAEAHLNYDGFRFDGSASSITLINCRAYANRDGGLVDNTAHATYSYSHFYANSIAILNSQDVQGSAIDGGHNLPADTQPAVRSFQRYPARVTFTIDDAGFAAGTEDYVDSLIPVFNARGLKLSVAVVAGYSSGIMSRIQTWVASGHDVNSHSWSHQYYTNTNAFSIRYTGSGTAAALAISANRLTTTVTGGPGGETLNLDFTNASYDTAGELVSAINSHGGYTAALDPNCRTAAHSIGLADIMSADIKSGPYTATLQKDRLEPDELAASKTWLESNIAGLSNVKAFVYPNGLEDSQTQAWAVSAGYVGARGAQSIGLGSDAIYSKGANIQNITSLSASSFHGITSAQLQAKIAAFIFKASVWGVPYGLFDHINELTPAEVDQLLDALLANGAVVLSNSDLIDGLAADANVSGTTTYVSSASAAFSDMTATRFSPILNAGANLGPQYSLDLDGYSRTPTGAWDIGAHEYPKHVVGAGTGPG